MRGSLFRFLTAGESHGKALAVIVEGMPAGVELSEDDIAQELARRRLGFGRGPRMRFEKDEISILSGVRFGRTLGSPIAVEIANTEWPKWEQEMSIAKGISSKELTQPRPGHADLAGMQKYGFSDARDVLERASARETAARVVAGAIAKKLISNIGIQIISHVISIGSVVTAKDLGELKDKPKFKDLEKIDASEVRCFDPELAEAMVAEIKAASKVGDSLGGSVEVIAYGVPVGLGSHVHYDRKLDGLLAQAFMSIQAVKAVEIGMGSTLGSLRGSVAHDEIHWESSTKTYARPTVRAGGIEGGISAGGPITAIVTMKPLATLNRPSIKTVDVITKESKYSFKERTDVVAVPALGVVSETMMAIVLADMALEKFGGDSLNEFTVNFKNYKKHLNSTPSSVEAMFGKKP